MDFTEVTKICNDYTINGIASMTAVAHKPFRFVYASGHTIERDQSKAPLPFLSDYRLMRVRKYHSPLPLLPQAILPSSKDPKHLPKTLLPQTPNPKKHFE